MYPIYENKDKLLYVNRMVSLNFPSHLHALIEFLYVERGEIEVQIGTQEKILKTGEFALIFPNVTHRYRTLSNLNNTKMILAICQHETAGDYLNIIFGSRPDFPFISSDKLHPDIILAMSMIFALASETENLIIIKSWIQLILARCFNVVNLERIKGATREDLASKIVTYISEHYREKLTLETLSKALLVNRCHISRIFSENLHISFNDYLNNLRVDYAKKLLSGTFNSISDICYECGFDNQHTFNRVFLSLCQKTPREYRKSKK